MLSTRHCQEWLRDAEQCQLALQIEATEVRTLETLERTQAHLLQILDRHDVLPAKLYKFLAERFNAIRHDLCVQGKEVSRPPIPLKSCCAGRCLLGSTR